MKIKYNQNLSFPSSVISKNMYQTWPSGQNVTLITVNNNNSPKEPRNDWGILTIIFKQKQQHDFDSGSLITPHILSLLNAPLVQRAILQFKAVKA